MTYLLFNNQADAESAEAKIWASYKAEKQSEYAHLKRISEHSDVVLGYDHRGIILRRKPHAIRWYNPMLLNDGRYMVIKPADQHMTNVTESYTESNDISSLLLDE